MRHQVNHILNIKVINFESNRISINCQNKYVAPMFPANAGNNWFPTFFCLKQSKGQNDFLSRQQPFAFCSCFVFIFYCLCAPMFPANAGNNWFPTFFCLKQSKGQNDFLSRQQPFAFCSCFVFTFYCLCLIQSSCFVKSLSIILFHKNLILSFSFLALSINSTPYDYLLLITLI